MNDRITVRKRQLLALAQKTRQSQTRVFLRRPSSIIPIIDGFRVPTTLGPFGIQLTLRIKE